MSLSARKEDEQIGFINGSKLSSDTAIGWRDDRAFPPPPNGCQEPKFVIFLATSCIGSRYKFHENGTRTPPNLLS